MLTLALVLTINSSVIATPYSVSHRTEAMVNVAAWNLLFGCLRAGVGQVINDGDFWEGCGKGSLAGSVIFLGKYVSVLDSDAAPIAGKLVHGLGVSILNDTVRKDPLFSSYGLDIGPAYFEVRRGHDFRVAISPLSMGALIYALTVSGQEFDFDTSLKYLTPVMKSNMKNITNIDRAIGLSIGNNIFYKDSVNAVKHEYTHSLQYSESMVWNAMFERYSFMKSSNFHFTWTRDAVNSLLTGLAGYNYSVYEVYPTEVEAWTFGEFQ